MDVHDLDVVLTSGSALSMYIAHHLLANHANAVVPLMKYHFIIHNHEWLRTLLLSVVQGEREDACLGGE